MQSESKPMISGNVLVAGAAGMVGSAICRALGRVGASYFPVTRQDVDFRDRRAVDGLFAETIADNVVIAAARVGGIFANSTQPAEFIFDNLMIEANIIDSAYRAGISKLLFLGSSCIYPKFAEQPIAEESLLTGNLEPTNEAYAIAKIAGIKMCEAYNKQAGTDYRSVMPTNLYGPGDNYSAEQSHVIPGLIRRFHEAKQTGEPSVTVWGSGRPRREFLHVDDLAEACLLVMATRKVDFENVTAPDRYFVNVGTGEDITISELADAIKEVVGFNGEIIQDTSKPDGTPRKLLNVRRVQSLGWRAAIGLESGLKEAYEDFLDSVA